MRFHRHQRHEFTDTPRKRAAVLRRQRKDREALPLFADEIAAEQPSVDKVMTDRAAYWIEREQRERAERARQWLEVRAKIRALPERERRLFLAFWNSHRWFPGTPSYCATVLHCYRKGEYVEHQGALVHSSTLKWHRDMQSTVEAATDAELDALIQRHINMALVEKARAERARRFTQSQAA